MPVVSVGRRSTESAPPRMEGLARLPIFLALAGKRAVVAGSGAAVAWKAELLSAAGAAVDVFAAFPCDELRALAAQAPCGAIALHARLWRPEDFTGAAIAVGGCDDEADAECFARAARAAGVPVNVIDKPAHCDFSFGAIVNRSPLVIGISTDGAAPMLAQAVRARIEAVIPRGYRGWAAAARRWRTLARAAGLSGAGRRRFWRLFTRLAERHPDHRPSSQDFEVLLSRARDETADSPGNVTLVGVGPGDPELLTLRAARALQSADVILIDDLVAPGILDFARREAKKMLVGTTGYCRSRKQGESVALMIALARSGKRVVRLKGGNPMTFGPGEETAACQAAGIPVEVVPGVAGAPTETSATPEKPPRACCGSPAAPPADRAPARRSAARD
jgi:uroporphyrin-III C-methyltransferase/precorrin-2 dehydrogenase/sirohydrochlorin ferrochelatase